MEYAKQQTWLIKSDFSMKFDQLDKLLQDKLEWLEDIRNRVNAILEI